MGRNHEPGPADHPSLFKQCLLVLQQVNKSVLVKARLSTDSVGASVAVKSWWNPSSTAAVSCTYPFGAYNPYPKLGLTFGCENFGNIRCVLPTGAASELPPKITHYSCRDNLLHIILVLPCRA